MAITGQRLFISRHRGHSVKIWFSFKYGNNENKRHSTERERTIKRAVARTEMHHTKTPTETIVLGNIETVNCVMYACVVPINPQTAFEKLILSDNVKHDILAVLQFFFFFEIEP